MAERYTRLYTLPANLYVPESPVVIAAGALLKDNQSGRVLTQLKFRSISDKVINAVKVLIIGYDMSKEEVCREEHQYLDLNVSRNGVWGAKEAIPLPERSVRSFFVHVLAVHYSDGSHYFAEEQSWMPLPVQQPLSSRLFDGELVKQYRLDTTKKSEYVPLEVRDLWLCSCGEINRRGESCHSCGQEFGTLKSLLNVELLREEKSERLKKEAQDAAEAEVFRANNAKRLKIALLIFVPIIIIAAVVLFLFTRSSRLDNAYDMAQVLLDAGKYSEAADAFDELGNYRDAADKASSARASAQDISAYEKAGKMLENGRYDDAYTTFVSMGDYRDSAELAKESLYRKALELIEDGKPDEAAATFLELGDYKNSAQSAESFIYRVASEACTYDAECDGPLTTSYTYDSHGRVSTKTALFSAYPGRKDRVYEYSYSEDGSYTVTENQVVQHFDAHGNYIGQGDVVQYVYEYGETGEGYLYYDAYSSEDGGFVSETICDARGNRMNFTTTDGSVFNIFNEYDGSDNLTKQETFAADGTLIDRSSFEYDENGLCKRLTYMDTEGNTAVTEYTYALVFAPDAE